MTVSLVDMKILDSPASTILVTNSEGARYDIRAPLRVVAVKRLTTGPRGSRATRAAYVERTTTPPGEGLGVAARNLSLCRKPRVGLNIRRTVVVVDCPLNKQPTCQSAASGISGESFESSCLFVVRRTR